MQFNKTKSVQQASFEVTIISKMMKVVGDIESASDIRIEGEVVGTIHSEKKVIIAKGAKVLGSITAGILENYGTVEGNCSAKTLVLLGENAVYTGTIACEFIEIARGCKILGQLNTHENTQLGVKANTTPPSPPIQDIPEESSNIIPINKSMDSKDPQDNKELNQSAYW
jgi:cytoskeletal protein CcmA (bactofilin family)